MTLAAVYVRISRDLTGEARGVDRQREDCLALVERLGWQVYDVYVDNDISATSGKPRPGYRRMLDDLRAGKAQAIAAWHPDRLYRRAVDLGELVDVCKDTGVKVATVNAGEVDLNSPTGLLVADMLAAIAMYEVRHKSERWTRSWRQGRERGEYARTGSRLFGYTRDGDVIESEALIAKRMFGDVASGTPILAVARWLESEGIQTTRGSVWRTGTVRQYLANPRVAGLSTLKGEVVADGDWQPIVDRETFETVQALLTARRRDTPPRVSVLNGLIFCGRCGHRLITSKARGHRTYRCPNRPGMPGCGGPSARAAMVEDVVETYARERLTDDTRIRRRTEQLQGAAGSGEIVAQITDLEQRLVELEAQLDEPGVPVAKIVRAMDRAKTRVEDLQADLAQLVANRIPDVNAGGMGWPEDLATRRQLIQGALEGDVVYLDPAETPTNKPDPARVRIGPPK